MKTQSLRWLLPLLVLPLFASAQKISPWSGYLLSIEKKALNKGYFAHPEQTDTIKEIGFSRLNFINLDRDNGFPGVDLVSKFAFLLDAQMTIDSSGCYEFSVASDDGSRLWIGDSLVVENDLPHKWRVRRDTQTYEAGNYPMRIWYYNAYIPLMGLAVRGRPLADSLCRPDVIELTFGTLFANGSSRLSAESQTILDELTGQLEQFDRAVITVTGHTDRVGSEDYNQVLSLRRARAVATYLQKHLDDSEKISFEVVGKGESMPITEANEGNRRVEVRVQGY